MCPVDDPMLQAVAVFLRKMRAPKTAAAAVLVPFAPAHPARWPAAGSSRGCRMWSGAPPPSARRTPPAGKEAGSHSEPKAIQPKARWIACWRAGRKAP